MSSPIPEDKKTDAVKDPPPAYDEDPSTSGLPTLTRDDDPTTRPPLDYSSLGAFFSSLQRRFASIWTKRFILSLVAGQVVSLCITCTNVTTTELVNRNWALPTTQTFFL